MKKNINTSQWIVAVFRVFMTTAMVAISFIYTSPVKAAPGAGTYDNTDAGWTYTGTWTPFTGLTGPTLGTLHRTETIGDKASFTFSGTQFKLKYTQNTNRGNADIYLDGNLLTTLNQNGVFGWQAIYTSPIFATGTHTVEFRHAGVGTYIDIDEIEILTTVASGVGVYDDSHASWSYTGPWTTFSGLTGPTNGTLHRSETVGDKASFSFNGTQFILKYTQNTNRGNLGIYLDGNLVTTLNENGVFGWQMTYTSPVFISGTHTVEFRNAGGNTYVDIDEIEILETGPTTPLGAGVYDDSHAGWSYTGPWTAITGVTGPTNGTLHRSETVGDKANFTFNGTQFILKYTQNTNRGNLGIYLDGNLVTTLNENGVFGWQMTYTSPVFTSGTHTVEFRNAGGNTYVDIDEIEIIDTGTTGVPDLTVSKSHTGGGFEQGDIGRTFTITVTNSGDTATTGTVTVVDTLPSGLTATAISGSGWSCTLGTLTCTRSDSLEGFLSYPNITLTVNVGSPIPADSLTNEVTVSGGGDTNTSNNTDSDEVTILKPDLVILGYELRNAANDAVITTPLPDEAFHIRMTVKNQGTAPTGLFYPGVFLDDQPNYGPDTNPFGRVSDWGGYRRTPAGAVSGVGCMYYDPTDSINPLTTPVDTERGNYTRSSFNSSLDPGAQANVDVYIGYLASEPEYSGTEYDPYRNGLPAGSYTAYLYVDPNCSGGAVEINESNEYGPINITVTSSAGVPGVGVYDDADVNWSYTGPWTAITGATGPTNGTLHRSETVGDKASFLFSGTQFKLKYTQNTNRGNLGIYLDGNLLTTLNQNGALGWQMIYTSPIFAAGTHTVEFRNAGGSTYVDVDGIEILATVASGVGVYDDNHAGWSYTGPWTAITGATGPTNGTLHRSETVGDKASFLFSGTQFKLKYTQNTNRGNLGIYLDGNLLTTLNQNGAIGWQTIYTSPIFAAGTHTVEFRNAGGNTYVDIDEIEILATAPPGTGVYDDTHIGWMYTGPWTAITGATGPTNGTLHRSQTVGDKASFTFSGTQFKLKYTQNTNRGNLGVYLDGNLLTTLNENGALQWQKVYTSPVFASGTHTVELRNAGGNTYVDIDEIEILNSPAPGAGTYDNANPNWIYIGPWTAITGATGPTNGTLHRSETVGDKAFFTFSGTQFILKYTQNTNRGNVGVYVDGNLVTTLNENGVLQWQTTYTSPVFAAGAHTVEFRNAGGNTYVDIDAIQIQ